MINIEGEAKIVLQSFYELLHNEEEQGLEKICDLPPSHWNPFRQPCYHEILRQMNKKKMSVRTYAVFLVIF